MSHFISITDIRPAAFLAMIERAVTLTKQRPPMSLAGKCVGIYFKKTSTRTRTAFTVAAQRLGAHTIVYGARDLQDCTGESDADIARVLARYLDVLVIRDPTCPSSVHAFACQNDMSIINAMSDLEHPTQTVADFATIYGHFGRLKGLRVLYLGEGNSTAASLALAASRVEGMVLQLVTPQGYGIPDAIRNLISELCAKYGGRVMSQATDPRDVQGKFDVVYTTRWLTTGTVRTNPEWRQAFEGFCVTTDLMARVGTGETVFMHDLPAVRGEDVQAEVLEGPTSLALLQASNKLPSAMAVLEVCCPRRSDQTME